MMRVAVHTRSFSRALFGLLVVGALLSPVAVTISNTGISLNTQTAHGQVTNPPAPPSPIVSPDDLMFTEGNPTSATDFAEGAVSKTAGDPTTCDAWYKVIYPTCLWRGFMAFLGTALVTLTAWLLGVAGLIFNFLLDYTIVEFASKVYAPIQGGIETGWQAFRDIANIVIIGMFTFVAISMILGVESFGSRKLVARVLIIAILINFSLLFTKLIIDSSHFIAFEFHKAALGQVASGSGTSIPGSSDSGGLTGFTTKGIAGQFIQLTGLSGIWDTATTLVQSSNSTQSGWLTLAHALAGATLLLAAALVLLYGAFILVARAVTLIFLLTTSSLAFASYLIPKIASGKYGWDAWWQSLINNAIFAPLLMVFLWMSLTVGNQLVRGGYTLGKFFDKPTDSVGLEIIFGYLLVVGLLFASIRVANTFASEAAKKFAGLTTGGTLGLGALIGRRTLGLGALAALSSGITNRIPTAVGGRVLESGLQKAATGSFDVRKIPGLASATQLAGINLGKAQEGGIVKAINERDKRLAQSELAKRDLVTRGNVFDRRRANELAQLKKENEADEDKLKQIREQATPQAATPQTPDATQAPAQTQQQQQQPQQEQQKAGGGTSEAQGELNLGDKPVKTAQDIVDRSRDRVKEADAAGAGAAAELSQTESSSTTQAEDARIARVAKGINEQLKVTIEQQPQEGSEQLSRDVQRLTSAISKRNERIKELETREKKVGPEARGAKFDENRQNAFYFTRPVNIIDNKIVNDIKKDGGKSDADKLAEAVKKYVKNTEPQKKAEEPKTPTTPPESAPEKPSPSPKPETT